jgi:hypothetical protein
LFALLTSFSARDAVAQSAAAEALFEEGRRLMDEGKLDQACPKLAESFKLDPALGALLNLALCHEQQGRTATAWSEFKDAIGLARQAQRADREAFAQQHIDALAPQLMRLQISLAPDAAVDGLEIERGGVLVGEATFGVALPVDPGPHQVSARAPGYKPWTTTIEVSGAGQVTPLVVPALERDSSASPAVAPTTTPTTTVQPSPPPPALPPPDESNAQAIAGWVTVGVGGVGLVLGGIFGGLAISKAGTVADNCQGPDGSCANPDDLTLNDEAGTMATLSNVFFIAGGVLAAGGLVLVLTAPGDEPSSAWRLEPTANGIALRF